MSGKRSLTTSGEIRGRWTGANQFRGMVAAIKGVTSC